MEISTSLFIVGTIAILVSLILFGVDYRVRRVSFGVKAFILVLGLVTLYFGYGNGIFVNTIR